MKDFDLKGYKIDELSFTNKLNCAQKLELGHKYSYSVRYAGNTACCGIFTAEISDKAHPENFNLKLILSGQFITSPNALKEVLHVKTYDALFPYVKSAVTSFTVNAGIPPIFIPYIDISSKDIYRVELPNLKNPPKDE